MALEQRAIGRRIAELREDRRLTQPVVAERVGVSLRGYQKWEAGTTAPAWRNLEQLAEVFNVSADYLLGAVQERRQEPNAQLDRIEDAQRQILEEMADLRLALLELARPSRQQQPRTQRESRPRKAAKGGRNRKGS